MSERFSPFGAGRALGPIGEDISLRTPGYLAPLSQEAIRAKIVPRNQVTEGALSQTVQLAPAEPEVFAEQQDI